MKITNEEHRRQCEEYSKDLNDHMADFTLGKLKEMYYAKETEIEWREPFKKENYQDILKYADPERIKKSVENYWFMRTEDYAIQTLTFNWHNHLYHYRDAIQEFARVMQSPSIILRMASPDEDAETSREWEELNAWIEEENAKRAQELHTKNSPKAEIESNDPEEFMTKYDDRKFLDYLTEDEVKDFLFKESQIRKQQDQLFKDFNKIGSDRITKDVLIGLIKDYTKNDSKELESILLKMENKALQAVYEILQIVMNK